MNDARQTTAGTSLLPDDEPARLAAVRRYDVLDTPEDGAFDRITALAARHFQVPIAIVSIVDSDRIWFKSHHGLDVREIGRDPGLCASAILQHEPWVVENAAVDPRTLANPLVAGDFGLRFYAGVPLRTHDGHNLGTLCVIDQEAREISEEQTATLRDMAAIVMDELELRLATRRVVHNEQQLRDQAERMARSLQESLLPPRLPAIAGAEVAALYRPASSSEVGGDFYDVFELGDEGWALVIGDVSGKGAGAAAVTALARHTIRTAFLASSDPAAVLATLNRAMFVGLGGGDPGHFCTVLLATMRPAAEGFALTVSTAGHPPALLLRDQRPPEELAAAGGPPVGWHADAPFGTVEAALAPGDALVLYTDGLSEARTADGLLGADGLAALLDGQWGISATELAQRLTQALSADGIAVRDDAAAIVLRVNPSDA
jgi:sigma-B regulation protein RsbU (phosphoserine phosphatase)